MHRYGTPEAPTVLLVHGLTEAGTAWLDLVTRWGQRFDIVAPDLRGHGKSPLSSWRTRLDPTGHPPRTPSSSLRSWPSSTSSPGTAAAGSRPCDARRRGPSPN